MEKTNNLNRYRYLVAKSSAKVNSTDNEKLISTNTTQTIIVVPFLDSIDVSHGLNDLSITKNQNGALSALGDNQIGIFDCDLPYSIIFGMVDNDKVKMLYAENVLNDSTIVQIPFFEIDINYTRKIQLLNYILYTKGFLGKLQYMINNSDKVLPETEPLFLAPNRYQEVYNNGCTEQPIINNSAYFTYS
ncbi:MAG: hypothetical protein HUJ68_00130 [Clostridia bacterium]|nr:hypothetical protein [Clostridia bacterium]